jgi:hypothetical protein
MKMRVSLMGALAALVCVAVTVGNAQQATPSGTRADGAAADQLALAAAA